MLPKKQVAISACLLGCSCRYDASDNFNESVLATLSDCNLIPFCPEDDAFGSPRPTMDLIQQKSETVAISNETGENLSHFITDYAHDFFDQHPEIDLFVGKDRSPSCGVCSAKIYDHNKNLLQRGAGLMAQVALDRGIESIDSEQLCNSPLSL